MNQNHQEVPPHTNQNGHHQNSTNNNTGISEEKGTFLQCWWECKLVQPLWRTVWRFLKKVKMELLHDPMIPFVGIYLAKTII